MPMDISNERLPALVAAADYAYQRARTEVYDQLPVCVPIDQQQLTAGQLDALASLIVAEAELANYRYWRFEPGLEGSFAGSWSR
jgi:hypothetical protein